MNANTGEATTKLSPLVVTESIRSEIRRSFLSFQPKVSFEWVMSGSEVTVAIPETTEFDWLACAMGPVTNGSIRSTEIAVPNSAPNKIIDSKVLVSI
jgi:hypothetical protein